jgi:hypothetical protein
MNLAFLQNLKISNSPVIYKSNAFKESVKQQKERLVKNNIWRLPTVIIDRVIQDNLSIDSIERILDEKIT